MAYSAVKNPKISAKEVHYHSDGTGRDKYIWWSNGGCFKNEPDFSKGGEIGTFRTTPTFKPINNYRPNKHIHYHADGTGRDTYVITDEGGLAGQAWSRFNYIQNYKKLDLKLISHLKDLRSPLKRYQLSKDDIFSRVQNRSTKNSDIIAKGQLRQSQTHLNLKLSQPKLSEDPYREIKNKTSLPGLRRI